MRILSSGLVLIAVVLAAVSSARCQSAPGQAIIENGNFDNPADPLKGWVTDYAWTGNSNYIANKSHITVTTDGARKNIVNFGDNFPNGVKMETRAFPLEPGFKYTCNLDIKGGGYRVYFAGYQWAPGIHPHDNPELGELRMVYNSKALNGESPQWKTEKLAIPGVTLSDDAKAHLKKVRFLTLYISPNLSSSAGAWSAGKPN